MAKLTESGIALLGSATGVDMKTAQANTIYTTPPGKVTRITEVVLRDISASLAGGTSYTILGMGAAMDLSNVTGGAGTAFVVCRAGALLGQTEIGASTAVTLTVTTGSTAACTATVDVFGYEV